MPDGSQTPMSAHRTVGGASQPCPLVWVEIKLLDEENQPVPGERYRIDLSDGSVIEGALDGDGMARVDGIERGNCRITFPNLDRRSWHRA